MKGMNVSLFHRIALVLVIPVLGSFMTVGAAAAPSVNASYSLNMLTFQPLGDSKTASSNAMVAYDNGRELLEGFKVWAGLYVDTSVGAFRMYSSLTGSKGGSTTCEMRGTFTDTVTVNTKKGSSLLSGMVRLSGNVHCTINGSGMHGGDIALRITIHNSGSAAKPKNIDTILTYFDGWGDSQIDLAPLVAQSVAVDKYDRLQITAVQTIKAHVFSEGAPINSYSFEVANFHETSLFHIDALTSDLELISESSHDYSTPRTAVDGRAWLLYR